MKRDELPEILFKKMKEVGSYPNGIKEVENMLDKTAFFPGGKGLWLEDNSKDFPNILVLGQDFSTVKVYDYMMKGRKADLDSQTWKNLIKLFNEVNLDLNKCYFSNVFMGLRDSNKMTGKFPGFKDKDFVDRNLEFLLFQIEIIKPNLVITLGKYAAEMIANVAETGLDSWKNFGALRTPNIGLKSNVSFNKHSCICVALEHTSFRHVNVKRRVYKNYNGHEAEVKMLKDALKLM
jgi:hypothetical protein